MAGAAVGTADAIATAPFGAANAYDNGYHGPYYYGYYDRLEWRHLGPSLFFLQWHGLHPGTLFKGDDGRRHLGQ